MPYKNPEDKKKNRKRYYRKNKESIKAKIKEWQKEHPEKLLEYSRSQRARDPEKARQATRKSYHLHRKDRLQHGRDQYEKESLSNPEKLKSRVRKTWLKWRYGITLEQFNFLMEKQNNRCAICSEVFTRTPHIDHDHSCCSNTNNKTCGKCFRGLLCVKCNVGLGSFNDDFELMLKGIEYLRKAKEKLNGLR